MRKNASFVSVPISIDTEIMSRFMSFVMMMVMMMMTMFLLMRFTLNVIDRFTRGNDRIGNIFNVELTFIVF